MVENLMQNIYSSGFTVSEGSIFDSSVIYTSCGERLSIYCAGVKENPLILFINALGAPAEFFEPFAKKLVDKYFVVTWDYKGMPGLIEGNFNPGGPDAHAKDVISILDHLGTKPAMLLGWCSGAQIALYLLSHDLVDLDISAILLCGSYGLSGHRPLTESSEMVETILQDIRSNNNRASGYMRIINELQSRNEQVGIDRAHENSCLSKSPIKIAGIPFRADQKLLIRYAQIVPKFTNTSCEEWASNVSSRCYVFGGKNDKFSNYEQSLIVSNLLKNKELTIVDDMDHYDIYWNEILMKELQEIFLSEI